MLYQSLVPASFAAKVQQIAGELQVNPDWLMMVMYNESRFNPAATNSIGAVGLIQFIPSTFQDWGYTKAQMQSMSAADQLELVKRFYWSGRGKFKSYPDLHLYTFFPAALGKPDNWVLQTASLPAETVVSHNPGFDINNDKRITVGEYKQRVYQRTVDRVGKAVADQLFKPKQKFTPAIIILVFIGIIAAAWLIYRYRASISKWIM